MKIAVCVGSSCHLKGSYDVIKRLKQLISDNQLEGRVELTASFCLGNCRDGVAMTIDDAPINGANAENIDGIFHEKIKSKV